MNLLRSVIAIQDQRQISDLITGFPFSSEGMMHLMDHEKVNAELIKLMDTEGLDVQLSYDGLRVPITL